MYKYKTVTQEVKRIDEVTCNMCERIIREIGDEDWDGEFAHIHYSGGYDSKFGDGAEFSFDVCDLCLRDRLLPMLKIPAAWTREYRWEELSDE